MAKGYFKYKTYNAVAKNYHNNSTEPLKLCNRKSLV
jgi:hypothetical protein